MKKASPEPPPLEVLSSHEDAEYEKHVSFIQRSFDSKKWSMGAMMTLLEETAEQRRRWIRDENPSVSAVLEKFPCLMDPKVVCVCTCVRVTVSVVHSQQLH